MGCIYPRGREYPGGREERRRVGEEGVAPFSVSVSFSFLFLSLFLGR